MNNLQERNDQVLNNISQLQTSEQQLYSQLNNPNLTQEQKALIIQQINQLSQIRLNLYSSLNTLTNGYQQNINGAQTAVREQLLAINVVEQQLNNNKIMLNALDAQKRNKLRLIEINTYYGKRFNSYKNLMKIIFIFCLPILILTAIYSYDLLPPKLYAFLVGIIIIIAIFVIGYQIIDISNRDNMNWDEYNWYFNKSLAPSDATKNNKYTNPWLTQSLTCIGEQCCSDGDVYDSSLNKCIPSSTKTETMVSGILSKYGFSQIKPVTNYNTNEYKSANSIQMNFQEI
jgi:hypothetical protein